MRRASGNVTIFNSCRDAARPARISTAWTLPPVRRPCGLTPHFKPKSMTPCYWPNSESKAIPAGGGASAARPSEDEHGQCYADEHIQPCHRPVCHDGVAGIWNARKSTEPILGGEVHQVECVTCLP